jgi:hypothetical protein
MHVFGGRDDPGSWYGPSRWCSWGLLPRCSPEWRQESISRLPGYGPCHCFGLPLAQPAVCAHYWDQLSHPQRCLRALACCSHQFFAHRNHAGSLKRTGSAFRALWCVRGSGCAASHARRRSGESAHSSYGVGASHGGGCRARDSGRQVRRTVAHVQARLFHPRLRSLGKMPVPGPSSNERGGSTTGRSRAGRGSRRPRSIQSRGCGHIRQ